MRDLLDRLEICVRPFCASLAPGQRRRAAEYLTGLLLHLEHKTAEGIAYLLDNAAAAPVGYAATSRRGSLTIVRVTSCQG
jgi:hypothetical protein